jgi:hypothetical protein
MIRRTLLVAVLLWCCVSVVAEASQVLAGADLAQVVGGQPPIPTFTCDSNPCSQEAGYCKWENGVCKRLVVNGDAHCVSPGSHGMCCNSVTNDCWRTGTSGAQTQAQCDEDCQTEDEETWDWDDYQGSRHSHCRYDEDCQSEPPPGGP